MQYISSIRPQAEIYGICKIIPPDGWAPPLALDKASFKFNTVIQAVHRLQDRLSMPAQQAFYEELRSVMNQEGKAPKKAPSFGGREVDLYKMYRAVAKRGGYAAVTEEKKWKDIVRVLQVCPKYVRNMLTSASSGRQAAVASMRRFWADQQPEQWVPTAAGHRLCCSRFNSAADLA